MTSRRATGASLWTFGRSTSPSGSRSMPRGPSSSRWGTPAWCARRGRGAGSPVPARRGQGVGHRGVLDASARDEHPRRPGGTGRGSRGRTHEIQRLVGRSAPRVVDFEALGERTVTIDCASCRRTGGRAPPPSTGRGSPCGRRAGDWSPRGRYPEIPCATMWWRQRGDCGGEGPGGPRLLRGLRGGCRHERGDDGERRLIEVQGTAEREPFTRAQLDAMLSAAAGAGEKVLKVQRRYGGRGSRLRS